MKKVIAYSLWGDNPKYTLGAVANAWQVPEIYPGWKASFYCGTSVPEGIVQQLLAADAEVVHMHEKGDNRGMFWRFCALDDPEVGRAIFRDTDSRLTQRERNAVYEWEESGLPGHIMRDNPQHAMLMLGGMWGCIGGVLPHLGEAAKAHSPSDAYNQDQLFLAKCVYPILRQRGVLIHDAFFRYEPEAQPFPTPREADFSFVGEAFDANGQRESAWRIIQKYDTSWLTRLHFRWHRFKRRLRGGLWKNEGFI